MAGELKAIRGLMDNVSQGQNPSCLKEQARVEALSVLVNTKADRTYTETTRKSLYSLWGVVGAVAGALVMSLIKHVLG